MARVRGQSQYADFLFVQMQSPQTAPPDWEPAFLDYLYSRRSPTPPPSARPM